MDRLLHSPEINHRTTDHATHQVGLATGKVVDVESAIQLEGYQIQIQFSDGHVQVVDFGPFLSQSLHPDIRAYLDTNKFRQFTVVHGNLIWNDYDLCFPVADLYNGEI